MSRIGADGLRRPRFSTLSWQIIFFNAAALAILIVGTLLVQTSRVGLVDERMAGIRQEALIVAGTLAEYATDEKVRNIDQGTAEPLLRQLIAPTPLRARLYGPDGQLAVDTRELLARDVVETRELPPLDTWSRFKGWTARMYDGVMGVRPFSRLAPYFEAGNDGRVYSEVNKALDGDTGQAQRVDDQNKLVLSVAVPVQRFRTIYGVLMLSTEGGDIDSILREERASLIGIALVALAVMVISSLYLSGTIAEPVRQLAAAADRVRSMRAGRESIPQFESRGDEIADLALSLSSMTQALYDRIDAIESFAADVAHELKNPLTSLKNAVEMLVRAKDDNIRARLMAIVHNDVKRIDRLITDISDASRLDAELSREANEPVDLGHLLETIVEVYRLTELPRGVQISLSEMPPDLIVLGRDERLGQIFRNLIDNAVSFTPDDGTVAISAIVEGQSVRVAVEDRGPGIPPENLETIFNRFYTERPDEHGFGKNSGLGLSIARQIAAGIDGRIRAENVTGVSGDIVGARFIVELPLSRPA
ncbi:MAG: stimulus-sensing domain-containing protein [Rhizomicrobium sp.]